jgi:hypothetical protein
MLKRLLSAVCAAWAATAAFGQALNYAQSTVEVRAGVLLVESQRNAGAPTNRSPHIWANLDKDKTVKPAKWTFTNPLGQTSATQAMINRWSGRPGGAPALGARLAKSAAGYWEVPLAETDDRTLSRFDVLTLTINGLISLNSAEREKLRKFCDQGGVLWIDLVNDGIAPALDLTNPGPIGFDWIASGAPLDADIFHPVLRFPNAINLAELGLSEYSGQTGLPVTQPVTVADLNGLDRVQAWIPSDSLRLQPVVGNVDGETVSVGRIGDGFLVVTARGVTANLNRGYDAATGNVLPNTSFFGLAPARDAAFTAAAKLAVNIVSLGAQSPAAGTGSRRNNSTSVDLTAPLLRRFSDDQGGAFGADPQPILYQGRLIVTRAGQVQVFDTRPDRDIDGNGNRDDGAENPIGSLADLIWSSPVLGGRVSSPVLAEVPETPNNGVVNPNRGNARVTRQVWVTTDSGRVHCFDLDVDPNMNPQDPRLTAWPAVAVVNPPTGFSSQGDPVPPAFHEGVLFVSDGGTDGNGRLWAIDCALGTTMRSPASGNEFLLGQTPRIPVASATPTVGYIPIQDASGGVDRVLYVPTLPGSNLTPRPAGVLSVWFGARGEVPVRRLLNGTNGAPSSMTLATRAQYLGLPVYVSNSADRLGVKVSMIKPNGAPFTQAELSQYLTGGITASPNGEITVQMTGVNPGGWDFDGTTGNPNLLVGWRVDYTVDWGQASTGFGGVRPEAFVRGSVELQNDASASRRIVGPVALGPEGNLLVVTSGAGGTTGGSFYNFKEDQGLGNFRLAYRWDAFETVRFNLNDGVSATDQITLREAVTDEDELTRIIPFLGGRLINWRFVGGPSVRGDTAYVMARADKALGFGNVPTGILLAFKASPPAPTFEISGSDNNFNLVQPDVALSTNKQQPERFSQLSNNSFSVEPVPNTGRSRVTLNNMMSITRGRMSDALNASMPIILRRPGQTDVLIEPEALVDGTNSAAGFARGRFSAMQWYITFNGFEPGTAPNVAGQTLYLGGSSVLPALARGQFPPTDFDGLLFGMDALVSQNSDFLRANTVRPWHLQLNSFLSTSGTFADIRVSDSIKWPQFRGIRSFDDFRIRILQAAVEEDIVTSIAAGDDSLAAVAGPRLYGFSRSDFLVADSGRVARFDPAGNPIWNTDQTFQGGNEGSILTNGNGRQLSEPSRIYPAGENGFWIVDTGNDRVVRVDAAGRELRAIAGFKVDPQFSPSGVDQGAAAGLSPAESRKLKRPRDVITFESLVDAANNPFSNPQPTERWFHTLIADAGNFRVVELVDRYAVDPVTGRTGGVVEYLDPDNTATGRERALGVLLWHTPEELSSKGYGYNSLARTSIQVGAQRRNVVAFGFSNVEPGRASFGLDSSAQQVDKTGGTGGVVLYDGATSIVITQFERPNVPANAYVVETNPGVFEFASPAQPGGVQKFVGLRSVTLRYVDVNGGRQLGLMVTDATGVYELVEDLARPGTFVVRWMLPAQAYTFMRRPRSGPPYDANDLRENPRGLRPMYARRLDSGEVLIVNGYTGTRFNGAIFNGEVILVDGSFGGTLNDPGYDLNRPNLGFNSLSIKFELPPVQGVRELLGPVFAERQ